MPAVKTIEWTGTAARLIDQTQLPLKKKYLMIRDDRAMWEAIKALSVRGAPAIGVAAAYGLYLGVKVRKPKTLAAFVAATQESAAYLATSRPTAVNLFWALDRCRGVVEQLPPSTTVKAAFERLLNEAVSIHKEDEKTCSEIGRHGAPLLKGIKGVVTHCNAGSLATAGEGTALSVITHAAKKGKFTVYADETRPLLQGARLTAWEMVEAGIDVKIVTDGMAATVFQRGLAQAVVVGADRIAANGDAANKIGTLPLAIVAKHFGVPFYVAAPLSTFDASLKTGAEIPIEERKAEEITHIAGTQVGAPGAGTFNPAFDVTPASLIAGIVTEVGVLRVPYKKSIAEALKKKKK